MTAFYLSRQSATVQTSDLEDKVRALGVQINTTIKRAIQDAPQAVIEKAMESLREAISVNRANNPSGFFYKAVTDAWNPNEISDLTKQQSFNEWWELAYAKGVVIAATQFEGRQQVLTSEQVWMDFDTVSQQFPVTSLQDVK